MSVTLAECKCNAEAFVGPFCCQSMIDVSRHARAFQVPPASQITLTFAAAALYVSIPQMNVDALLEHLLLGHAR